MNKRQAAILSTICLLLILLVFGIVSIVLDLLNVDAIVRIIVNILHIVVLVVDMVVWAVIIKRKAKEETQMDKKTKTILVASLIIGGVLALAAVIIIPIVLLA